ncbi:MAG: hypothetical protein AAF704_17405 [Cyanobacteria bacterium P01_D01_bin.123]
MPKQSVLWLEVPFTTLLDRQPEDAQTEFEGKNVGFVANQGGRLGTREFLSENPAARRFLELVSIPQADVKAEMSYLKAGADSAAELRTRTKRGSTPTIANFNLGCRKRARLPSKATAVLGWVRFSVACDAVTHPHQ